MVFIVSRHQVFAERIQRCRIPFHPPYQLKCQGKAALQFPHYRDFPFFGPYLFIVKRIQREEIPDLMKCSASPDPENQGYFKEQP